MERVTFRDEKVLAVLSRYTAVKVNIDRAGGRELCRRYRPRGGIPSYAVVLPDGSVRAQFAGFLEPAAFLESLKTARPEERPALPSGPELEKRVREAIAVFERATPGSFADRLGGWLGRPRVPVDRWVREQNDAMEDLVAIGDAAVPALLGCVESSRGRAALQCAIALGRIRAPEARPRLVQLLRHERSQVRAAAADALGPYAEIDVIPALRDRLDDEDESFDVRIAAADAIRRIAASHGGIADAETGRSLLAAAGGSNLRLRWTCLQGLLDIHAPIDLGRLLPFLDDHRPIYSDGPSVAANACWVLYRSTGLHVERTDGSPIESYSPEVCEFVKKWYREAKDDLVWDEKARRYLWRR